MRMRLKALGRSLTPEPVCELCGKRKGQHQANTLSCPFGRRGRANTYSFSTIDSFVEKPPKVSSKFQRAIEGLRSNPDSHAMRLRLYQMVADMEEDLDNLKKALK